MSFIPVPAGQQPRDGDDSNTPPTRSYVDALLKGSMSDHELESIKAEIGSTTRDEDDVDEARTAFHTYTAEDHAAALTDPDEARTAFHTYTPEERRADPEEARVLAPEHRRTTRRAEVAPALLGQAMPEDRRATRRASPPGVRAGEEARSVFRSPPRSPAPPAAPLLDDDDARTLMRPSAQPPRVPSSRPAAPATRSAPPAGRPAGFRAHASPSSWPQASLPQDQPLVDLGDLNTDPIPIPRDEAPRAASQAPGRAAPAPSQPPSTRRGPPSSDEIPLSVPSLRTYERRAIDDSYLEALGGERGVPRVALSPGQLTGLPLGAQAGFLLSRIDGESNVEDLIDISGLPRLDTLRLLYELQQQGVISVAKR
jgi:hypothetical protein